MATKKETVTETPELNMSDIQAQVAAILAQAQAEAKKIVEEAKAAVGKKDTSRMTPEEKAKHDAYMNEYVEVKLFKDNGKYKDDVYVAVNGENCLIRRGERVKIKRKFAEVLDNSEHQDYETAMLIEQKSGEWAKSGL